LTKKASKRKRLLGKKAVASAADRKTVKSMLPYDF
jgi:ribosomal protein L35